MAESLLVELLTEELPPKALWSLGKAFAAGIAAGLRQRGFLGDSSVATPYATPRRLAVAITQVLPISPDSMQTKKLMPLKVAIGIDGHYTEALLKRLEKEGFPAASYGRTISETVDERDGYIWFRQSLPGVALAVGLQESLDAAISKLPIPKVMSYQRADGTTVRFVRPAHRLVALHGAKVVPISVLGLAAGRITDGHRFLGRGEISVATAEAWEPTLEAEGRVIPSFSKRQKRIEDGLRRLEQELSREIHRRAGGTLPIGGGDIRINVALPAGTNPGLMFPATTNLSVIDRALSSGGGNDLLEEVTALVEWPFVYWGKFDQEFLEVPIECLSLTMKQNQKYFPVFNTNAQLLPYFAVVSNMELEDASNIITGNERVIRPRLSDARFFYLTDKKTKLQDRVGSLATAIFHSRLGSQLLRVERIRVLAQSIAKRLNSDVGHADRTALLCKADLSSAMVTEFPELQGVMGRYYAIADGESEIVANAIEQHYRPRFADDHLPEGSTASAVAIADRLDSLVGLFGVGERPTGDKDRYGLRRQALAVLRTAYESRLPIDLHELLREAKDGFGLAEPYQRDAQAIQEYHKALTGEEGGVLTIKPRLAEGTPTDVYEFMLERLRNWLREKGYHQAAIEAVLSLRPGRMDDLEKRLLAVEAFSALPEAEALASANKRISNILRKSETEAAPAIDRALLADGAEHELYAAVRELLPVVTSHVSRGDYIEALRALASARGPVDRFFDDVMVMADDPAVRANRLALLCSLSTAMNQVADISFLDSSLRADLAANATVKARLS